MNLSIGLNTGPATVGYIGSERCTDYTAIGDTVNLAARLQSAAKPGLIYVSDYTVKAIGDLFDVEPAGELKLKGYDHEIGAHSVLRVNVRERQTDETAVG